MKVNMKMKKYLCLVAIGGGALFINPQSVFAQRDAPTRDERRAQRQQANQNLTPEQRQQNFQARMQQRMQSMTPEQRQRMQERMQQWQQNGGGPGGGQNGNWQGQGQGGDPAQGAATTAADQWRAAMIAAGIVDTQVQDEIVAFLLKQQKTRASLLTIAQTAAQALIKPTAPAGAVGVVEAAVDGQPAAPAAIDITVANAEVERTLGAYEVALEAEKERYAADLKELDQKISFSTTPRIKAFLSLIGVLNFESYALGGPEVIFASPGGQGRGRGRNRPNRMADEQGNQVPETQAQAGEAGGAVPGQRNFE